MKSIIVGTAGHIDHGKSALVRALTGTDPDRLEEEKRRGITIDIGFATLDLNGYRLGFVDVPGHERFVKNMLAGVGGIDLVLLVIAADESIQPQTREHFDICRLLEIPRGIVVMTKADLVDADALELVKLDAEEFVKGSFLEGAPVVAVSSRTGQGMDELREVLRKAAAEVPAKDSSRHFRLPIDRAFLMKGFGTVITGTLISGQVRKEAEVETHPGGKRVRVRGIQVHNQSVDAALAGQRTALNLSGADANELARGMTLAEPGRFVSTRRIDSVLQLLGSAPALKNGAQVHFHCGTAETIATAVCLEPPAPSRSAESQFQSPDRKGGVGTALSSGATGTTERRVEPGQRTYVQFRLRDPVLLLPGDRFIIRKLSPLLTIGGGRVLNNYASAQDGSSRVKPLPAAEMHRHLEIVANGSREDILSELLHRAPTHSLTLEELIARTGWLEQECRQTVAALEQSGGAFVVSSSPLRVAEMAHVSELSAAVMEALAAFHKTNPLLPGASVEAIRSTVLDRAVAPVADAVLKRLVDQKQIAISGEVIRLASHKIVLNDEEEQSKQRIARAFERAGLTVPAVKEVLDKLPIERRRSEKILQMLIQQGVLVRVSEDLVFHVDALRRLRGQLATFKTQNAHISVAAFKDLAQISRKYAIPLLEYFDRERVTRRSGDDRILL